MPKSTTLTTSILLIVAVFSMPAFALSSNTFQSHQSSVQSTLPQTKKNYLLAQANDTSCRQVISKSGVNVRNEPTVISNALGTIKSGRNVTIANTGTNGWVPLTAPIQGSSYFVYDSMSR
ncbi:SH3 type 3 domain protein [Calothrix sp. NIES-4071]|nr:SH3 type 3 domain protein [Calothrix sp. NIES-4071]BAZ55180.1 SH3 type 3 domain protein [Calothrix sp. NIES-4105]